MSGPQYGDPFDEEAMAAAASAMGQHTQFLDLTNGEGGERLEESDDGGGGGGGSGAVARAQPNQAAAEEEDDGQGGGGGESPMMLTTSMGGTPTAASSLRSRSVTSVDPSTPGRVVESGQEHTGRWTKEEHEAFLTALQMYGKEWKKVAAKVKTRTVVQTRTHAQKYFQKLQKTMEMKGEDVTSVDMGVSTEPKKIAAYQSQQGSGKKKRAVKIAPKPPKPTKVARRSSHATLSAAQVISTLSSSKPDPGSFDIPSGGAPLAHGFSMSGSGGESSSTDKAFASPFASGWKSSQAGMKIVAPDPNSSRGKFPEPSPAATGKRKLAEIAAARMLAGVASDGPPTPPLGINMKDAPLPPLFGSASKKKSAALQIVNPASLGVTHKHHGQRKSGDSSPVTPWDGDLESLISQKIMASAVGGEDSSSSSDGGDVTDDKKRPTVHPVCGPPAAYGRGTLHQAVCEGDFGKVESLLATDANKSDLYKHDEAGFCPIHTACAVYLTDRPKNDRNEMVQILLAAGTTSPAIVDSKGNTPLHWAARAGDRNAAEQLLRKGDDMPDERNQAGETPLHWAMRAGHRGTHVTAALLDIGANPAILDLNFHRPVDVAGEGFADDEGSLAYLKIRDCQQGKKPSKEQKKVLKLSAGERRDTRANLMIRSAKSRTLVLHHPECLEHHTKSDADWEAPDRINTIMRRVLPSSDSTGVTETSGIFPQEVTVSTGFDRANLDLLSRVHSAEYLSFVNDLSKDLERKLKDAEGASVDESDTGSSAPVIPFTPMVQRTMIKINEESVKLCENSDTSFSAGSLRAARRAAGAVQHAVDRVLVGRDRNAFCVVRPPGHHAGINGLLEGGESCGFCIFNNVAAGALHAIADDKLLCDRCAIVDIDVHHGNGTEEIVRKCNDPSKLFFFSIHLYDNDRKKRSANQFAYKFYPGTGSDDDLALNIINVPIVPLWKDPSPAAAPVKTHNTRKKARSEPSDDASETSVARTPSSRASDGGASETGSAYVNQSSPHPPAPSGRMAYRQAIQNRLLPALRAFNPDLILISAGFDAAKGDVGNARHERGRERLGLDLEPEDYAWTTRKILEIADICCHGKVVSVLEGGYGRTPPNLPTTDEAGSHVLDRTVFGECAIRHLHALIDPYDAEGRFSSTS